MIQLTYADRELFLQTFDDLKERCGESDREILRKVTKWAAALRPQFGFEESLSRDVTQLSKFLLDRRGDDDIQAIARGGLLYVLKAAKFCSAKLGEFGLLDDAFVANYAVNEIRQRLDIPASYGPPTLSEAEQERAKSLFLKFTSTPFLVHPTKAYCVS
ncbi:MAG: hypothetical protein RIC55_20980 [Pirellulaceae bacterium]